MPMNILALDDAELTLEALVSELRKVFPGRTIHGETRPLEALTWSERLAKDGEKLDYAFLAIRMRDMDGLELARRIRAAHPRAALVFCTAHPQYALDAYRLFARGYLLKPVRAEDIIETLDEMACGWRAAPQKLPPHIRVQTFGHFEIFVDGRPLAFGREKARELLAYLVDRRGAAVSTQQIAVALWEDRSYDRALKNYISTILGSLRKALCAAGIGDILIKSRNRLSIDTEKIQCDAYDFERGDAQAIRSFRGEYMVNYSWAESTAGSYARMERDRRPTGPGE